MADQWYYQLFGQEYGPVGFDVVAQKFQEGELGIRDMVRQGTRGTWVKAGSLSSLTNPGSSVAVETADVATDIDSFLLVDEKPAAQPQVADDIDSFFLVDEKSSREPDLAMDIDSFQVVDEPPSSPSLSVKRQPPARQTETDSDTPNWYFQTLGQELGPVALSELVGMVERSELQSDDLIRMGARGEWVAAGDIDGLFPNTPRFAAPQSAVMRQPAPQPVRQQPAMVPPAAPVAPAVVDAGWYCYINDQEYGPMSIADLQGAAANGQVFRESYVKYGAQGEWVLASQVQNLFAAAPPVPVAPPPVAPLSSPSIPQMAIPAAASTSNLGMGGDERNELVQQLLMLLKQGLSAEMLGGAQPAAPVTGLGWYCNISGSVIGPVSIESLVQMVLQKRLFPDDLIRMGPTGDWFPANSVPELFPNSSPQGKSKKAGVDSPESVMERIDRMYKEGQEAQAKADANKAASPADSAPKPRHNPANDALKNMNANIARGATAAGKAAAAAAKAGGGDSFADQFAQLTGGLKLDAKTLGIGGVLVVLALGYFVVPMLMSSAATRTALGNLAAIHGRVTSDEGGPASMAAKSKDLLKEIDVIIKSIPKGAPAGSAQRDVGRLGRSLKEMVEAAAKPQVPTTDGSPTEYERASKIYDGLFKTICKKLGIK